MSKFKYHILQTFVLSLCTIILSNCNGSTSGPWTYTPPQEQAQAEKSPSPLSDIYGKKTVPGTTLKTKTGSQFSKPGALEQYGFTGPQSSAKIQQQAAALQATRPDLPTVKVALLLPLSGQHAALGQAMLNASQIAMFDVGHTKFQLVPRDTQGTSRGAAQAAQEAINDGAQFILGPVFADSVRSVKSVAKQRNINVVAFSTDWTLADNNTFLIGFLPFGQVERIISYAATQGISNIGVMAPNTPYGNAALQAYRNAAYRSGIQTIDTKTFSPTTKNLSATVKRFSQYGSRLQIIDGQEEMAPAPFDAVFLPTGGDTARTVSNLYSQYGMLPGTVRRLGTGLWDDDSLKKDKSLRGAWFAAPSPKSRKDFENRYWEFYGESAHRLSTLAYDATALAAILAQTGLQSSGIPAFDTASITNPNGFIGIDGIFRFRHDGLVERGLAILEFRRGQIVQIDNAPRTFQNYGSF